MAKRVRAHQSSTGAVYSDVSVFKIGTSSAQIMSGGHVVQNVSYHVCDVCNWKMRKLHPIGWRMWCRDENTFDEYSLINLSLSHIRTY